MECHSFVLQPVPPFRRDLTVWTLRRRPDNALDRWDGRTYRRVLVLASLLFPGDDVAVRKNLQRWLRLTDSLDYEGIERTLARWRDYGGLIYFHLLLDRLAEVGHLEGGL